MRSALASGRRTRKLVLVVHRAEIAHKHSERYRRTVPPTTRACSRLWPRAQSLEASHASSDSFATLLPRSGAAPERRLEFVAQAIAQTTSRLGVDDDFTSLPVHVGVSTRVRSRAPTRRASSKRPPREDADGVRRRRSLDPRVMDIRACARRKVQTSSRARTFRAR